MRKIIAALALLATTQANAADFTLVYRASQMVVHMTGTINFGDEAKAAIAFASDATAIELNSPGGNVVAAVHIGDMIARNGMDTIVDDNTMCASACAFIWLGGNRRFLSPTGRLGFHGAYNLVGKVISSTSSGNALVGAYMARRQLKDEAIEYFTTASPNQMTWVDIATTANFGIRAYGETSGQINGFLQHEQDVRNQALQAATKAAQPVPEAARKPKPDQLSKLLEQPDDTPRNAYPLRNQPLNIKPPLNILPASN